MNKFANIVVHLNEDNIEEVKELLLSKGEKIIDDYNFVLFDSEYLNYLKFYIPFEYFYLGIKESDDKEITLEEFKRLINEK